MNRPLDRIIKKATKTCSTKNRFVLMEKVGAELDKWYKRNQNNEKYKDQISQIKEMTPTDLLEEIDKYIITAIDKELNKSKEPRIYEPKKS